MAAPRWFYALLATCIVVLTAVGSYTMLTHAEIGRWVTLQSADRTPLILDSKTGTWCALSLNQTHCTPQQSTPKS